ncbi:MAG: translation initiation factor IF-2 [Candidatus Omnitrophica bacterium]|nr:translation initiation factor IF-2 [Candidatus Omnitrophota bacterium]
MVIKAKKTVKKEVKKVSAAPKKKAKAAVVKPKIVKPVRKVTKAAVKAPKPVKEKKIKAEVKPQVIPGKPKPIIPEKPKEVIQPTVKPVSVAPVTIKPQVKPAVVKPVVKPVPMAKPIVAPQPPPPAAPAAPVVKKELKELELELPITLKDLAIKLQEKPSVLIKTLMDMKVMVGINQFLDEKSVVVICEKYGYRIKQALTEEEEAIEMHEAADRPQDLKPRPPIVTFMGHVDHGKTSLLDAIRETKVVDTEHGGITQHIGAYRVNLPEGEITFLDTPGHEAFTAMRARGASVTDIVVLVVAADDGVMPQTREAIDHARAAGVSIIVAANKIDKPQANIDQVKKQLSELNLMAEDWGGKTITVPVSAKTGAGIDDLLEMILLEAQVLELKANPNRLARGIIIEAKMSKGRGPVATLLVQNGTLHLNDNIVAGNYYGKIRGMFNHLGHAVTAAGPSHPVEILGLSGIPPAGEQFFALESDKQAKEVVELRQEKEKQRQIKTVKRISLEDLYANIKEGKIKELKLIIKADVQGSLEAIKDVVGKISTPEIRMEIIHEGVGNINSSDVILAIASNALILGFNIQADDLAKELSAKEGVEIKIYNIIYELASEIKAALEGMLEPKLKKSFLGRVEVRKVFKLSRSGTVAGCFVTKGKVTRGSSVSLVRNGEVIFEGTISALKRFKDDVKEVAEGFECGITLNGFDNFQEGDVIEAHEIEKIARKL